MNYAPICIPTLNRYWHLRKCLESLSQCTWADRTEVYVALDYPPLNQWDKYASGWEKTRDYLHSVGDMGFKKLHLIERQENFGIWTNPAGKKTNLQALLEEYILGKYESYICTEDDNVFAPSFLEYMNKGYELFRNDPKVFCISAYRFYFPVLFDGNTFFRQTVDYAPWGVINVASDKVPFLDYHWFRKHLSFNILHHLKKNYGIGAVCSYISMCCKEGNITPVDRHYWTYMQVMGLEQITPVKNLVQNIGCDGSGQCHDARGQEWINPELNLISTEKHFEFIGTGYEHFDENNRIYYTGKYWMTDKQYYIKICRKFLKLLMGR